MKNLEELKKELEVVLKPYNIIVDEITTSKKGKYQFLTIVLDKVGGINLDEIVDATNIINPIVDKYDICDDSYILDVISKERGN
jgi:ribosome maturation factor RimP